MLLEAITAGVLIGQYIYHRFTDTYRPKLPERFPEPRLDEGAPMPFFYGRCLIRNPIVAWHGNESAVQRSGLPDGEYIYTSQAIVVMGVPFFDGLTTLHSMYLGDSKLSASFGTSWPNGLGYINPFHFFLENSAEVGADSPELTTILRGEFGDGNSTQTTSGSAIETALVFAGYGADDVPGFRGYAVLWFEMSRFDPQLPALPVEMSTDPFVSALPNSPGTQTDDPNPVDVLYDLYTSPFKLAKDPALIDLDSWQTAAQTLHDERHGYSRCFDDGPEATDVIDDVLRQIDGVIDEDPSTGKLRLKLIRADFNPATIPAITANNCERIEGFAAGGWTDLPNKILVSFTNRADGYRDGSASSDSLANAAGQDGVERPLVIQYRGCNTQDLADALVAREAAAHSRPLAKMRAIVDRSFWRTMVGDPIAVTWPEYNISGRIFRVAAVSRGGADSNTIALDLIEDFFYTHRFETTDTGGLPVHPGGVIEG